MQSPRTTALFTITDPTGTLDVFVSYDDDGRIVYINPEHLPALLASGHAYTYQGAAFMLRP